MLTPTQEVLKWYRDDEFKVIIVTGDHGYGKSSYANRIIAEIKSKDRQTANWDLQIFKKYLGFHPVNVTDTLLTMEDRDIVFHWDDAGLWLNAMDYQDPFVIAVGKYLQVARTDWASIIFTAIDKDDIFNKLRMLRGAVIVEITKNSDKMHPNRRKVVAYRYWKSRTGSRKGTKNLWEENFNCMVPGNYSVQYPEYVPRPSERQKYNPNVTWGFYGWYYPLRRQYAKLAKQQMREYLKKRHPELWKSRDDFKFD